MDLSPENEDFPGRLLHQVSSSSSYVFVLHKKNEQ